MLVGGEADRKLEVVTKSNKTEGKISTWNGVTIPLVSEKDGLHNNPNRIAFVTHHFQAFIEVEICLFEHYGVVITAR